MHLKPETIRIQSQLADYCRTGKLNPIEGAKSERLPTYRRLVFNVLDGALEQAYPITNAILDNNQWQNLLQSFFTLHNPSSNQIWQMPQEFLEFVVSNDFQKSLELPFLNDLLLFEWKEIEIFCMKDGEIPDKLSNDLSFERPLFVNPDSTVLQLEYPVHKYSAKELSTKKGDYYLFVFRHITSGKVHFIEISPLYASIIENCVVNNKPLIKVVQAVLRDFGLVESDEYLNNIKNFITSLSKSGGVLGSF